MLSGAVTKAVNHCHSISSYPYFHINTKLALSAGAATRTRQQHVPAPHAVAGSCHRVPGDDSTAVLIPPSLAPGAAPAPAGGLGMSFGGGRDQETFRMSSAQVAEQARR